MKSLVVLGSILAVGLGVAASAQAGGGGAGVGKEYICHFPGHAIELNGRIVRDFRVSGPNDARCEAKGGRVIHVGCPAKKGHIGMRYCPKPNA